jgi:hypothetical protein
MVRGPPMTSERPVNVTYSGDAMRLELRPSGCARVAGPIFLAGWLWLWAFVEAAVINLLLAFAGIDFRIPGGFAVPRFRIEDGLPFVQAFAALWLFFWTWAGIGSIGLILRLLFGSDTVEIAPSYWARVRSYGLFSTTRRFERGDAWYVIVERKTQALVARQRKKRFAISTFGTNGERQWIANEVTRFFGGPPRATGELPEGFVAVQTPEGVRVSEHRTGAVGCSIIALLFGPGAWLMWFRYARANGIRLEDGTFVFGFFALAMLLLSVWALFARQYWIVRNDQLIEHLTFPGLHRRWEFRAAYLDVEMRTDSDGDEHYDLFVRDQAGNKRRLRHAMNDPEQIVAFAKFLEKQTGWRLEIAKGIVSS